MIYLDKLIITDDILFEKSRDTHELFSQAKETIKATAYTKHKTDVTHHYFKIFEKGLSIEFKNDITIIAGDNGSGKTSLLRLLKYKVWEKGWNDDTPDKILQSQKEHANNYLHGGSRTLSLSKYPDRILYLDGLHKGIIGGGIKKDLQASTAGTGENLINLATKFFSFKDISNGEALLDIYKGFTNIKNSLVILDEPETSMSPKSASKLCDTFKTMVANGNQLIISTHHPYLMNLVSEIYDIETKSYVDRSLYLKNLPHVG